MFLDVGFERLVLFFLFLRRGREGWVFLSANRPFGLRRW